MMNSNWKPWLLGTNDSGRTIVSPFIEENYLSEALPWRYKPKSSRAEQCILQTQYTPCDSTENRQKTFLFLKRGFNQEIIFWRFQQKKKKKTHQDLGSLKLKSRDFDSRLGGNWICVTNGNFFQGKFEFQMRNLKDPEDHFDPQPNPSVQPKARGQLHMEREYIAQHIWRENLGLEHLIASL